MSKRVIAGVVAGAAIAVLAAPGCLGIGDTNDGPKTKDAGTDADASALSDGAWLCTPLTCADIGADCGDTGDGCSSIISCGTCPTGQNCGAGGPNKCGVGTCTPTTCAKLGAECGPIGDGCGQSLDCGSCPSGQVCGAGGTPNQCACIPTTCAQAGKNCGSISDGCGGTLSCGTCAAGETCGAVTPNVCGCVPTTCAAQKKNCGSISDGCGKTLDCGSCISPSTCGALGTPNLCGCTPQNCPPIYQNSFESQGDFPSGWTVWHNCAADSAWSVARDAYPAPSGGSWGLRFHTTTFTSSCQYPGAYAQTDKLTALPGREYTVQTWSRNSANQGITHLIFFDAQDQQIDAKSVSWTPDAWQYGADPLLTATSPSGTASLVIRLELWTESAYADVDLLEVNLVPL